MNKPGFELPSQTYHSGDHVLIIGAGLAGCAVASVLSQRGFKCTVFDSLEQPAAATSAVPVAVYRPYPVVANTLQNQYYINAFERLLIELQRCNADYQTHGVLQLITDVHKWQNDKHWQVINSSAASKLLGRPTESAALYFATGGALKPADLCAHLLRNCVNTTVVQSTTIETLNQTQHGWQVTGRGLKNPVQGRLVVLANGHHVNKLIPRHATRHALAVTPVAGQLTHFCTRVPPADNEPVVCNRGHIIPSTSGYWAGATHRRSNANSSTSLQDDQTNLCTLKSLCSASSDVTTSQSWSGVRCSTADRMPLVGGVPDNGFFQHNYRDLHHGRVRQQFPAARHYPGLYVLAGLGSRGVTQAIYAAECLGEIITGQCITDPSILATLNPARFIIKKLRRRNSD